MRKLILFTLFLCISLRFSYGQIVTTPIDNSNFKHSLGIGAGFTTGIGLSYRYTIKSFKLQTTFAPIKKSYLTKYHVGLTALFKLVDTEYTDFYLYQGNYYCYEKRNDISTYYSSELVDRVTKVWNHGLGIGIEFILLKRVGFNLMFGYAGYDGFDRIGLTGETGLYYMF